MAVATVETTARRCKICNIPKALRAKCEDCETHQSSRSRKNYGIAEQHAMLGYDSEKQFLISEQHVMLGVETACQLSVLHSGFGLHVGNRRNNNIILRFHSNNMKADDSVDDCNDNDEY